MEYITLGATGLAIPRLAFGCAAMGGHDYGPVDDDESVHAVRAALDAGVTFFDVADVYGFGHAEEVLGRALVGRRHEAVLATKVGVAFDAAGRTRRDLSPTWIRMALDESLRRLKTDAIDLYQLHWPDPETPLEASLGTLVELQRAGKIRHIGICNHPVALVESALGLARIESIQLGYNLGDWQRADTVRLLTEKHHLTALAYNCLAQGLLTGKYDHSTSFSGTDRRQRSSYFQGAKLDALLAAVDRMRALSSRYGHNCAQIAIRWVLDSWPTTVAIVGLKRHQQLMDAVGALEWTLQPADVEFLRDNICPGGGYT